MRFRACPSLHSSPPNCFTSQKLLKEARPVVSFAIDLFLFGSSPFGDIHEETYEQPSPSAVANSLRPAHAKITMKPTVMKFGGTSVEDASAFRNVAAIVRSEADSHRVVVVSAIAGFTNELLASVMKAIDGDARGASRSLEGGFERHLEIANQLLADTERVDFESVVADTKREIRQLHEIIAAHPVTHRPLQDEIAAYGEHMSSQLLAAVLRKESLPAQAVDARHCVKTDDNYGNATPLAETTEATNAEVLPLLKSGKLPVLGGFVGSTAKGVTTTLGRGGSDYTAALVGAALDAREIQIWTDVSGVLTADPRVVPAARPIPRLSYAEAAELAYFGAKVLHPKSIQPATDRRIPVRICNSRVPQDPGTLVDAEADVRPGAVKAIAHKTGVTVLQVVSSRMLGAYGFLRALFEVFDRHRTEVDVVTTSEVSVSLTLEHARSLPAIVSELRSLGEVSVEPHRAIVCVVGEGLRTTPGIAARVFATVRDINVSLISQGASRVNLTFVVEEGRVRDAVRRLHEAFFEREPAQVGAAVEPAG